MTSWWDLGEWHGSHGDQLALQEIRCPFCMEVGNFTIEFHAEKKKSNNGKTLNFDTLKCNNCAGYVMALWSTSSSRGVSIHEYRVLPWPLRVEKYPEHWPETVGRFWIQARRKLTDENWDAAVMMARSSLQAALREQNAEGRNLKQEIDDLAKKGILPLIIQDWAHNVRELGNESAHPKSDQEATDPKDAKDIVNFLDFLLEYLYTLPKKIKDYQARNDYKEKEKNVQK